MLFFFGGFDCAGFYIGLWTFLCVSIDEEGRHFHVAMGTSGLLMTKQGLMVVLYNYFLSFSWCFVRGYYHGIIGRAEFKVVFEFSLEEPATAVGAVFVLNGRVGAILLDAFGIVKIHFIARLIINLLIMHLLLCTIG
jgi:hypothetical protein